MLDWHWRSHDMGIRHKSERPLLLLDRDGTLIKEVGFPRDPKKVHLFAGVPEAEKHRMIAANAAALYGFD